MKIAIMSDSHDQWENLSKAIKQANKANCEVLLFAGDLISPPGIAVLQQFSGLVKFVWGNNEGERVGMTRMFDQSENMELCGDIYEGELDGTKIFMNHYPRAAELAAQSGQFDLAIHGHTHEYREEKVGECWLLNPGEIQGYRTGSSTFMIFDTETQVMRKIQLA
ncbi:metallophosphoesterase [Candidatus Woesebacteria bacterium]|nr:metallophosphoesterase [Candidatus Woesebacteria bacterium]